MPGLLWPLPRGVSSANDHSIPCCYFTWPANGFINHLPCWPDKPLRASSNHPRPVRNLSLTWSEIPLLLVWTPEHLLFSFCPPDSGQFPHEEWFTWGHRRQSAALRKVAAEGPAADGSSGGWTAFPSCPMARPPSAEGSTETTRGHKRIHSLTPPLPSWGFLKLELNHDQKTSFNWLHNRLHWYHTPNPTHKCNFRVFFWLQQIRIYVLASYS